ncbi:hypothetical protein CVV70_17120 [Ralstonia solanacearum]|nr:hypothetical protein CCY86_21330 [Ralstonia solanacearum]OPK46595.1 hypothetical protein B5G54_19050 [Ralstonia solanacearum]OPK52110.1 hypothetical protein B5J95_18260 [Ralstonia solanacearum]OPK53089.1 hypothetical protein B5S37_15480 [Ralstonia solanacearum]OYQ03232.1 hypothetical protein B7R79_22345 [Ralstonia solanacearum]
MNGGGRATSPGAAPLRFVYRGRGTPAPMGKARGGPAAPAERPFGEPASRRKHAPGRGPAPAAMMGRPTVTRRQVPRRAR